MGAWRSGPMTVGFLEPGPFHPQEAPQAAAHPAFGAEPFPPAEGAVQRRTRGVYLQHETALPRAAREQGREGLLTGQDRRGISSRRDPNLTVGDQDGFGGLEGSRVASSALSADGRVRLEPTPLPDGASPHFDIRLSCLLTPVDDRGEDRRSRIVPSLGPPRLSPTLTLTTHGERSPMGVFNDPFPRLDSSREPVP